LAENSDRGFIIRLNTNEAERILFARKWLYVGVSRDWSKGSRVLFVRKAESFLGSGAIGDVRSIEGLELKERELCLEKNWSYKIYFEGLARFEPPIPIKETPVASQNPMSLHGSELTEEIISKVEQQAITRIIT
jgi:hypothetical protein